MTPAFPSAAVPPSAVTTRTSTPGRGRPDVVSSSGWSRLYSGGARTLTIPISLAPYVLTRIGPNRVSNRRRKLAGAAAPMWLTRRNDERSVSGSAGWSANSASSGSTRLSWVIRSDSISRRSSAGSKRLRRVTDPPPSKVWAMSTCET